MARKEADRARRELFDDALTKFRGGKIEEVRAWACGWACGCSSRIGTRTPQVDWPRPLFRQSLGQSLALRRRLGLLRRLRAAPPAPPLPCLSPHPTPHFRR